MLLYSRGLVDHTILGTTGDIAIGDCLDKIARLLLPQELLKTAPGTMYGRLLSSFAFPNGSADYAGYQPPASRGEEVTKPYVNEWGWSLSTALAKTRTLAFSFSGLETQIRNILLSRPASYGIGPSYNMPDAERRAFAREALRVSFEHLASRTVMALQFLDRDAPRALVMSGGVAANDFLRHVFRTFLDVRGYNGIQLVFPPVELCTDNAAMIAWAGMEMYEAGHRSDLGIGALRKWPLDAIETVDNVDA